MLTKLTLTIDEDIVQKAKAFAQTRHRSVSRLVEEYLRNLAIGEAKAAGTHRTAPITDSITGMFKGMDKGESYRDLLESALLDSMK